MVGANPIVLVGTKMDLLPQGSNPKDVSGGLSCVVGTSIRVYWGMGGGWRDGVERPWWCGQQPFASWAG